MTAAVCDRESAFAYGPFFVYYTVIGGVEVCPTIATSLTLKDPT